MGVEMLVNAGLDAWTDPLTVSIMALSSLNSVGETFDKLSGGSTVSGVVGNLVAEMSRMFTLPMIGIISINADRYEQVGRNDTPESLVIAEMMKEGGGSPKKYITDNTAPRPRQWRIHGFIDSIIPALENGMFVKPSLQMQKQYLENVRKARSPFSFKTTDNEYVDALIESITFLETPRNQNKIEVDIGVKEFVKLEATFTTGVGSLIPPGSDGASALMQLPINSILNVGLIAASAASRLTESTQNIITGGGGNFFDEVGGMVFPFNRIDDQKPIKKKETDDSDRDIPVDGLSVAPGTAFKMKTFSAVNVRYTITPGNATDKSVDISFNQGGILTSRPIDNGITLISGADKGDRIITIKSKADPSKAVSFMVTVGDEESPGITSKPAVFPKSITLSQTSVKLKPNCQQVIKVSVNPNKAFDRTWGPELGQSLVANFRNVSGSLVIYAKAVGTHNVTIYSIADRNITATVAVEVAADGSAGDGGRVPSGPADGGAGTSPGAGTSGFAKDEAQLMEIDIPAGTTQLITGSVLYAGIVAGADTEGNVELEIDCNPDKFYVKMVFNSYAERKYNDINTLIEETARSINVYEGIEIVEGAPAFKSQHHEVEDLQAFVNYYVDMKEKMQKAQSDTIDRIRAGISSGPDSVAADNAMYTPLDKDPPDREVYESYLNPMIDVIGAMEEAMWPYGMKAKIFDMYRKTVAIYTTIINKRTIHQEAYADPSILPDFNEFIKVIAGKYEPYLNMFTDRDFYHKLMYYTATINSKLHPNKRTFAVKPDAEYFTGAEDYNVRVLSGIVDVNGNIPREGINSIAICIEVAQ
jgi:hypothetical protein